MRRGAALCLILCLLWSVLVPVSAVSAGFADDSQIPAACYGYVALAQGLGMVEGDGGGRFQPNAPATRAQAAVMLYNLMAR